MANIKSSKKSIRKIAKLTLKNRAEKSRLKTFSKKLQAAKAANDNVLAKSVAIEYMSIIDKARKHGILHANKVNRMKSRLFSVIVSVPVTTEAVVQPEAQQ